MTTIRIPSFRLAMLGRLALALVAAVLMSCHGNQSGPTPGKPDGGKQHVMLTGVVVVGAPVTVTTPAGYGKIQVKYLTLGDGAYVTTWQVSSSGSGGPWGSAFPVLAYNTTSSVNLRVGSYYFRINPPAGQTAPAPQVISIVQNKQLPITVHYQ